MSSAPADAKSLRGAEFRRLLRTRKTWLWILVPALVLGIASGTSGPAVGVVYFAVIVVAGIVLTWFVAGGHARQSFWEVYARTHGLELGGREELPQRTPFLKQGRDRYATRTLSGQIAPGLIGTVGLFTYEELTIDSDGTPETKYYEFTFATCELPECAAHMPELYGKPKRGLRSLEKLEDVFRVGKQRVTLESEALGKRYEIFVGKGQDEIWTRRLFSPSFIVWLAESSPAKLSFELVDGTLVTYIPDHHEDAKTLETMAAATGTIAQRLLEESAQTS